MSFLRFLLVGGLGFVVDAGLTLALIHIGWSAETARIPAIAAAMLLTWLANRLFTFRVAHKGSMGELARYVAVALAAACFNYAIYRLLLGQGLGPLPAIVVATAAQAVLSFLAYRHLVFGVRRWPRAAAHAKPAGSGPHDDRA